MVQSQNVFWKTYRWFCWILFALNILILTHHPFKFTIAGHQVLKINHQLGPALVLSFLVIMMIAFDPSKTWLRQILRTWSGWVLLIGLWILTSCYGIALFCHTHYELVLLFWNGKCGFINLITLIQKYLMIFPIIGFLGARLYWGIRHKEPRQALETYVKILLWGLSFLILMTPLFKYISHQTLFLFILIIYSITGAQLITTQSGTMFSQKTFSKILIMLGISIYLALLALLLIKSYLPRNYDDFPFFIQSLFSLQEGRLLHVSWLFDPDGLGISYVGDHFSPFLLLLFPYYLLWPSPEMFITAQVIAVGLAAIVLYYLCRHKFPNQPLLSFAVTFVYIITPWIQKGFFFDFHQDAFKPLFIFMTFYALEKRRWPMYTIGLISLLCIKEDAFLVPIFFGAYAILYLKERKWGIISILIGIVWAFIVIGTVMPAVFPHDEVYRHVANRYGLLGNTHSEILKQVFFSPVETIKIIFDHDILRTLLYLFIPLACIPLISLRGILLMGPFLAQMLLSSWKYTRTLYFYYPFAVYPIVIIALILGLERIMKNFPNRKKLYLWLGYFLICSNLFFNFFFKTHIQSNIAWHDYYYLHESPLGYHFNPIYYKVSEHNRLAHRFIKEHIPPGVPLSVPVRFAAHLSNRQIIRMFPNTNGVDYVFLDLYGLPFAMRDGDNKKCVLEFLAEGSFGVIAENDGYILAKKGADTSINNNIIKRELWRFEAESLPHKDCGRNVIDAGNKVHLARVASPYYDIAGFLVYGPYIPLKAGKYTVMFSLKTSESKNDTEIAVLKITANHGRNLIAEKKILYQDFNAPKQYQQFFLDFELTAEEKIEFPVVYMGNTSLWLDYIQLMEQTLRVDES